MTQPARAEVFVAAYADLAINGEPTLGEGTTDLDGKRVHHLDGTATTGTVVGPSTIPGFVWVRWDDNHHGLHRLSELEEVS